jgi:hypothetical protein
LSLYIDADAPPWLVYLHRHNLITLDIKKISQDRIQVPPQLILRSSHNHKAAHLPAARVNEAGVATRDPDIDFDATKHPNVPLSGSLPYILLQARSGPLANENRYAHDSRRLVNSGRRQALEKP